MPMTAVRCRLKQTKSPHCVSLFFCFFSWAVSPSSYALYKIQIGQVGTNDVDWRYIGLDDQRLGRANRFNASRDVNHVGLINVAINILCR